VKETIEAGKHGFPSSFPPVPHCIPALWRWLAAALVLLSLVTQHGFPVEPRTHWWLNWLDVVLALFFAGDLLLAPLKASNFRRVFEARRVEFLLLGGFLLILIIEWTLPAAAIRLLVEFFHMGSAGALVFSLVKIYLLFSVCILLLRTTQRLFGRGVRPEMVLAGSFAVLILIGTFVLVLPNSRGAGAEPVGLVDAFFTATSATCVTGLVVRDTSTAFSQFGQVTILFLFQVGGLGIITFVAFLSVFSTRALPVPQMIIFRQIIRAPSMSKLRRQIVGILLATALIECAGAVLIFMFLPAESAVLDRIRWSVFHAVSAFCNAGFALQHDSLEAYRANTGLMLTFMGLIILGGLGFLTIPELAGYKLTSGRVFRRIEFFRRMHLGQAPERLSIQTKLALAVTLFLLVSGMLLFWALEYNHSLAGRPASESLLAAAFQSVTARTAGFNTVATGELQSATLVFIMMLMVIGANPVSTGGGIKTVSFAILLLALRAMVLRHERVEAFGRTVPVKTLFAALSVFVLYMICAGAGIFLLSLFDPGLDMRDRAFEVVSALSTVGLSTGVTAALSPASKVVLCVAMFVGRVGPISLVLSVFHSSRTGSYEYPEEEVVVG
jgi:trk system potassium uptake protein